MLSRRHYFTITLIMFILCFLFMSIGICKEHWNEYDKNEYAQESETNLDQDGAFQSNTVRKRKPENDYVIVIGSSQNSTAVQMAGLWCEYGKLDCLTFGKLSKVPASYVTDARFLIIDSANLNLEKDVDMLLSYAREGVSMIFSTIPDADVIAQNSSLRKLLGIYQVRQKQVELEGVELFGQFLLGGTTIYEATTQEEEKQQDLQLVTPWYTTYSGVKRYMVGLLDKDDYGGADVLENEDLPTLIWRNNIGSARIFAVNGDYMKDVTALGFYSAMDYEMEDYTLYPVVNAQNLVIADFAAFSSEQDEKMQELYSRSQKAVFRDIIWPSLASIFSQTNNKPTLYFSPKLDYESEEEPDEEMLAFYLKLLQEEHGENGLNLYQFSKVSAKEKLAVDGSFYKDNVPDYEFTSLYSPSNDGYLSISSLEETADVRTICMGIEKTQAPISYLTKDLTGQRATQNGFKHAYSDNLRLKSLETCLAYSNIVTDLSIIIQPQGEENRWEKRVERFASYTNTYWKPFSVFDKTVLTESDARVRQFLNLDYSDSRKEDNISLKIDDLEDQAYFILRTHNEKIGEISGGSYTEIEDHAYLITAWQEEVTITLKNDSSLTYEYQ